jgi:chromosome partitioning protein
MAQTISVLSLKGGTGKTTMVRTLADVFGRAGLDVLCVDLDPQGNLSDYLDVPPDASPTVADVLTGAATIAEATHGGVVPASPILAEAERSLSGRMGREQVLRKALRAARREHDVILVDSPPALGLLTINGLVAADWALVSSEAQYFALQGVDAALEAVEQVREYYNDDLAVLGVALNIADLRTTHSRKAHDTLVEHYGERVLATIIRASIAYAESAEQGVSILDHRPDLGADYLALADEVLDRIGERAARSRLASLREAAAA